MCDKIILVAHIGNVRKIFLKIISCFRRKEKVKMEKIKTVWFTPAEVLEKVYNNKISMGFLLNQCKNGQIPCQRMGTGKRGLILIPASFVQSQLEAALGKGNPAIQEIMYAQA